jgi:hypothetical protein
MKKKTNEFVDLANSDPRVDVEDLRIILTSKLELNTNMWILGMTVVLALLLGTIPLSNSGDSLLLKLSLILAAAFLYFGLVLRGRDPEEQLKRILKETDYLDAKEIVEKRKNSESV